MTAEQLTEYFTFLDNLRDSGETNMYGCGPYLDREFGLGEAVCRKVQIAWMETFDGERPAEERAAEAYVGRWSETGPIRG